MEGKIGKALAFVSARRPGRALEHVKRVALWATQIAVNNEVNGSDAEDLIVSALLHDVLEGTDVTDVELAELFGQRVAQVVRAVSCEREAEFGTVYLRRVAVGGKLAVLVKRCDWLDSLQQAPREFRESKFWEVRAALPLWYEIDSVGAPQIEELLGEVEQVNRSREGVERDELKFFGLKPCPARGDTSVAKKQDGVVGRHSKEFAQPEFGRASCAYCGSRLKVTESDDGEVMVHPPGGEVSDGIKSKLRSPQESVVRYDNMSNSCGLIFHRAFRLNGEPVMPEEIKGTYHKNGKWSYTELSVVVPTECVVVCVSQSTHSHADQKVYLQRLSKRFDVGRLNELADIPSASEATERLGVEITATALKRMLLFRQSAGIRQKWEKLEALASIPRY